MMIAMKMFTYCCYLDKSKILGWKSRISGTCHCQAKGLSARGYGQCHHVVLYNIHTYHIIIMIYYNKEDMVIGQSHGISSVSYTHLTLPTKRIV